MIRKIAITLAAAAGVCFSQVNDLRAVRTTSQQIVLSYKVAGGTACRVEVSESSTFIAPVHDVNPALFAGADRDLTRSGTHVSGDQRVMVIGQRSIQKALNGKRYSRSLQALTPHYIRISECGSQTITVPTRNLPFGVVSDPFPSAGAEDANLEGYYGYASLNPTDRSEQVIDHTTGMAVRKVTLPGDGFGLKFTGALAGGTGVNWTNPDATTVRDGNVAQYAGVSADPLFVLNRSVYNSNDYGLYQLNISLTATVDGGTTSEDNEAEICVGTASRCVSEWKTIDLSSCSLVEVRGACYEFGDAAPMSNFWWKGGEFPSEGWFTSAGKLGFRIRKKSTKPDVVLKIDSVGYSARTFDNFGSSTSVPAFCSETVDNNNGDGRTYVLCFFFNRLGHGPMLYSIDVDSGAAYYLGPLYFQAGVNGSVETKIPTAPAWDETDPRVFYTTTIAGTETRLYRCEISSAAGVLTQSWSDIRSKQPRILTCRNTTPAGYSMTDQVIRMGHPGFTTAWINRVRSNVAWALEAQQSGKLIFRVRAQQDAGGWIAVFDPNASVPDGCNSCRGRVVALSSFGGSAYPKERKFCLLHSTSLLPGTDSINVGAARQVTKQNTTPWGGPWKIQVKKPGCNGATEDCSLGPDDTVFEVISQSGSYDWVDSAPGGTDDGVIPLEPGDLMMLPSTGVLQWSYGSEYIEVVSKDDDAHTITVRRGTNILGSPWIADSGWATKPTIINAAQTIAENTSLYGICRNTALNYDYGGDWIWNFTADPLGTTYVYPTTEPRSGYPPAAGTWLTNSGYLSPNMLHFTNFGDHGTTGIGIRMQHTYRGCPAYYRNSRNVCYAMQTKESDPVARLNIPVDRTAAFYPEIGGKAAASGAHETHVKRKQVLASGRDLDSVTDMRPMVTAEQTNTLVPGTSNVYELRGVVLNRKHFGTLAITGDRVLRDISGPGSFIDDTKPFTYCVAAVAGECRPGSLPGSIYANSPVRTIPRCGSQNGETPPASYPTYVYGICVLDRGPYSIGPVQTAVNRDDYDGSRSRVLALHQLRPFVQVNYSTAQALPTGKWVFYISEGHGLTGVTLVKASPLPEASSVNPLSFERVTTRLGKAPLGTARVAVDFGYAENGPVNEYRCTSRQEVCTLTSATLNETTPFRFLSETGSPLIWSEQMNVQIPRIPGRVLYARARFFNAAGQEIGSRPLPPM